MKRNLSNQLAPETTARRLAKVLGVPVNCALGYLVAAFGHRLCNGLCGASELLSIDLR
jgi:hypothetical protein